MGFGTGRFEGVIGLIIQARAHAPTEVPSVGEGRAFHEIDIGRARLLFHGRRLAHLAEGQLESRDSELDIGIGHPGEPTRADIAGLVGDVVTELALDAELEAADLRVVLCAESGARRRAITGRLRRVADPAGIDLNPSLEPDRPSAVLACELEK